jgi:MFS family permease
VSPRLSLLLPLRQRNFALLWAGMTISLLGDGMYAVGFAWQAYRLSNSPATFALLGATWTLPTVVLLPLGGMLGDRFQRRHTLMAGGVLQGGAVGVMAALALAGTLRLAPMLMLTAVYGAGQAVATPAFEAMVPTLVGTSELAAASALLHLARPLAMLLLGPALGGALLALTNTGVVFGLDAASFAGLVVAVVAIDRPPIGNAGPRCAGSESVHFTDAIRFVRARPWLWGTLTAAALSLLASVGPSQVLVPYLVKNQFHAGGAELGLVRAAGGAGAIAVAACVGYVGLPARQVEAMLLAWSLQALGVAVYGIVDRSGWLMVVSLLSGGLGAVGNIVWSVLLRSAVPNELLARVSSLDWAVSTGLVPISYALTGPAAQRLGVHATLIAAGVAGSGVMLLFLLVPGIRDQARTPSRTVGGGDLGRATALSESTIE